MADLNTTLCRDTERWDAFVADSPQGSVFCSTPFLDALPVEYDLVTAEERGEIALGAVVLRRGGERLEAPFPMTMYQGVLCPATYCSMPPHRRHRWLLERLDPFLAHLERDAGRISFCLSHAFDDLRAFQWFHYHEPELGRFKISLRYTGLLRLERFADFGSYLAQVRTVRRQEYRKALADGCTVERSGDLDLLDELHRKTFERQGMVRDRIEAELVRSIGAAALKQGFGELLLCRDRQGRAAAATLFLYDRRCGYYLIGANDPEFRKSGAGTLLLMENVRRCQERGLSWVDFVGINSPNRGDFKLSFDAEAVPYWQVDFVKSLPVPRDFEAMAGLPTGGAAPA